MQAETFVPALETADLVVRVVGAAALGGLVGLERELRDQPAGLRTHMMVSLGSALFTIVGAYGVHSFFVGRAPGAASFDPTRVAAQVVTGIGFLGAGAIIRQGMNVRGLTTAAALWVTAAIGVAVGLGYWEAAVATSVVTVVALYGLKQLEGTIVGRLKPGHHEFVIEARPELRLSDLAQAVESLGCRIQTVRMETDEQAQRQLTVSLRTPARSSPEDIADSITAINGVAHVDWRG